MLRHRNMHPSDHTCPTTGHLEYRGCLSRDPQGCLDYQEVSFYLALIEKLRVFLVLSRIGLESQGSYFNTCGMYRNDISFKYSSLSKQCDYIKDIPR